MEIKLMRRDLPVWQAEALGRVRTTFCTECVVPDGSPDVGKILTVRGWLLLKGKEPGPRGLSLSGEARAAVLYASEDGRSLGAVRMASPFELTLETDAALPEALPQVSLSLEAAEARALNPRRLAADFAVSAEGEAFRRGSLCVDQGLPEGDWPGLHLLETQGETWALTGLGEKSFALREQFAFPAGEACPVSLTGEEIAFRTLDCQQVGDRAVLKGELLLTVWGLTETGTPLRRTFTAPFSQLLSAGEGSPERFRVRMEPCETWLELTKSLEGEVLLDAEIHAAAQLCAWSRTELRCVDDAYSNRCACETLREEQPRLLRLEHEKALLRAEKSLDLPGDLEELDAVLPLLGSVERDGSRAALSLDLLYRDGEGCFAAARRSLELEGEKLPEDALFQSVRLLDCRTRREGDTLRVTAEAELCLQRRESRRASVVTGLSLGEERAEAAPDLTLALRGEESLWELARDYGSSVELILGCNEPEESLLLIPREQL